MKMKKFLKRGKKTDESGASASVSPTEGGAQPDPQQQQDGPKTLQQNVQPKDAENRTDEDQEPKSVEEQQAEKSLSTVAAKSSSEDTISGHQQDGLGHNGCGEQWLELPQQQRNQAAECLNEVRSIRDEMGTLRDGMGAIKARVDAVERKLLAILSGSGDGGKDAPNRAAGAPILPTPLTASSNNETQQQQQRTSNTASIDPNVCFRQPKQQPPQPYEHLLKKVVRESFTCVGAANFRRFVERSTVLADRTGFVREVMDMRVDHLLLVLPRGVGKTMALSCLTEFLAQPQEPDYTEGRERSRALFLTQFQNGRQFRIATADPDFFEQHIAAHPVLFFSLSDVRVGNAAELEYALGERIKEQFELNECLLMSHLEQKAKTNRAAKRQMDKFDGFLKAKKIAALDWGTAITFIVNLLEEQQRSTSAGRQNNDTFIIVDDFDAPITQMAATKRGELAKQMDVMATFLNAICSTSARVVCAGTLRFVASDFQEWTVLEAGSNRKAQILNHFGFTRAEFNEMCRAYGVGVEHECNLDDLFKFYNGHRVCSTQLCSTWSLIQYVTNVSGYVAEDTQHLSPLSKIAAAAALDTSSAKGFSSSNASKKSSASTASLMRKFPSFHKDTRLFKQLTKLFSYDAIAAIIKDQLLTGTGYPLQRNRAPLNNHQLENLLQMAQSNWKCHEQKSLDDGVVSAFMEVLLSSGYLVHKRHHLHIPNAEMRLQIMEYLYEYHFEWPVTQCLEQTFVTAEALCALIYANDDEDDVQQKTENLEQELYNLAATTKQRVSRNERHIHTLFEMSLYAASEDTWAKADSDKSVNSHNNKRPDMTVTWRNDARHIGLMVEFKFDKSMKEAFAQIVENNYITQSHLFCGRGQPPINTLLALGVVLNEKTPNDVVEVQSRRWTRIQQESTAEFLGRCQAALAQEYPPKK